MATAEGYRDVDAFHDTWKRPVPPKPATEFVAKNTTAGLLIYIASNLLAALLSQLTANKASSDNAAGTSDYIRRIRSQAPTTALAEGPCMLTLLVQAEGWADLRGGTYFGFCLMGCVRSHGVLYGCWFHPHNRRTSSGTFQRSEAAIPSCTYDYCTAESGVTLALVYGALPAQRRGSSGMRLTGSTT